jgi:hypothetical protein
VSNYLMSEKQQSKPNRASVLPPVCSMAAVVCMLVNYALISPETLAYPIINLLTVILGPFVLLGGAVLSRRRARLGYILAAAGAILPLVWIFTTESRTYGNSWIALNSSLNDPDAFHYRRYCLFRIVAGAILLPTLIWALTRLLPSNWQIRSRPVNQRTWPAIVITLVFIVCWFRAFALPYRESLIVDEDWPELSILRVNKDGIAFHETRLSIYMESHRIRYRLFQSDRHLFQYSFVETLHEGVLTDDLRTKLKALQALPNLQRNLDNAPRALRTWHGEAWYTRVGRFAVTAFTTENATPPPADLRSFFREVEKAPSAGPSSQYKVRDVCLGFCYDPRAGLGYRAENQRCRQHADGKEYCL